MKLVSISTAKSCHVPPPKAGKPSGNSKRTIALIGPPNSGKSTLFNRLTMLRQKVANYPGVTVEHRTGKLAGCNGMEVELVDLPGIHGLTSYSEDEEVASKALRGEMPGVARPNAILMVLDSTHLERHLTVVPPVLSVGLPTLVLLNMADELESRGGSVDLVRLAGSIGAPVALVSAKNGTGLDAVRSFCERPVRLAADTPFPILQDVPACQKWAHRVGQDSGYRTPSPSPWTSRLDGILLHRVWGTVVFGVVVLAVFQSVFSLGQPLSNQLQLLLDTVGHEVFQQLPAGWLQSLLLNGIWRGVSSILIFVPQILLLFFFIGILEDSGYLARAALIADRVMQGIGLNGKSFVPLLSAYACAVPAIMATRTIEDKRDRIATILITPFMTCSARLPIYTLTIAAFVPNKQYLGGLFGLRAAAMLGLYVLGFLAAILTAALLKSSVLKSSGMPFAMQLPDYRRPSIRSLALRLIDRCRIFVFNAGSVILIVALVLWVLTYLPLHNGQPPAIRDSVIGHLGHFIEPLIRPLGFNWKIGIGLFTSIFAREVIVGTFGTIYGVDPETRSLSLQEALRHDLTPAAAAALVVFFAFALQCTSTLAVVRRETNSWKWPALQFAYMSVLAYLAAWLTYLIVGA
jgi:ferrous iron transport protein B